MQQPSLNSIRELYPFKSNFLKAGSWNMHYVDEGSGKPVLMLHGNPLWSFFYRSYIAGLSATHRVIAPDHMGFGLSDKPQDYEYSLDTHIDNIERLVNALRLDNITLVLHDWGGPVGMGFATRHPQKVQAIVALNSIAFSGMRLPWRLAPFKIPWLGSRLVKEMNLFPSGPLSLAFEGKLPQKVADAYMLPFAGASTKTAVLRFIEDLPTTPENRSFETILEIEHGLWMFREHPVCVIWGMNDWLFGKDCLEKWTLYYPDAKIHKIFTAGRYVTEDASDESLGYIKEFMARNNI